MTRGYQIAFILIALFFGFAFVVQLVKGSFAFQGLLYSGAAIIGLALDQRLRGAVAAKAKL